MAENQSWEPILESDILIVERQRNKTGWIVRGYFTRESSMDLAFVPDSSHGWKIGEPEHMEDGKFFKSRLWTTPSGWLHLTLRETPASIALTYMPN